MKLYQKDDLHFASTEATLSDLKAALAEYGMLAVPEIPTEAMLDSAGALGNIEVDGVSRPLWKCNTRTQREHEYYAMIRTAQEQIND